MGLTQANDDVAWRIQSGLLVGPYMQRAVTAAASIDKVSVEWWVTGRCSNVVGLM